MVGAPAFSDLTKALEICWWISENCFNEVNSADSRYIQFGLDIKNLEARLRYFEDASRRALQRLDDPMLDGPGLNPAQRQLEEESTEIIGDFAKTLQECRDLLDNHIKLERNRAGFIQNVKWGLSTQRRVDELRARIQFHTQKIYLLVEPVQLRLVSTIADDVAEILDLLRAHLQVRVPRELALDDIPISVQHSFRQALGKNPPASFTTIEEFPLKEGFNACHWHYKESTVKFISNGTDAQTVQQWVNLLKAHWIIVTLKGSRRYAECRRGSLYRRIIAQIEQRVVKEYEREELVPFGEDKISQLDESSFLIWPTSPVSTPRLPNRAEVFEEPILKLSLPRGPGVGGPDLVVSRLGASSFRVARTVIPEGEHMPRREILPVNTHRDRIIPWYAATGSNPVLSVGISREGEAVATDLEFQDDEDLFSFQRALTSYRVVRNVTGVGCTLNIKNWMSISKLSRLDGRVQLWSWDPPQQVSSNAPQGPLVGNSSDSSTGSPTRYGSRPMSFTKVVQDRRTSVASTANDGNGVSLVAVKERPLPMLLVFAVDSGSYNILCIELDYGFYIDETACECEHGTGLCRRSVIKRRSDQESSMSFTIRRVSVDENRLEDWDLAIFGQPRHPRYDKLKTLKRLTCRNVELEFDSVERRVDFGYHFKLALALRDDHRREVQALSAAAQSMSQRPGQAFARVDSHTISPPRTASIVSSNSSPSTRRPSANANPPLSVGPIPSFSIFNVDVFNKENGHA